MSQKLNPDNKESVIFYIQIETMPRSTKFYSELLKKIVTKTQIVNKVLRDYCFYESKHECMIDNFGELTKIDKARIMREGKAHDFNCEFATGRHCQCWCAEKYHGWMGQK